MRYSHGVRPKRQWIGYAWATAAALACTLAGFAMRPRFDLVNVAMVYLLAVVIIALRGGPAITASGFACWRSISCRSAARHSDRR
jgi:K+-sensing histidine kinase KdpD